MRILFSLAGLVVVVMALTHGWPHHATHTEKYAIAAGIISVFWWTGALVSKRVKSQRKQRTPSQPARSYSSPFSSSNPARTGRR